MQSGVEDAIEEIEELVTISDYESLLKRIKYSERLNLLLSLGVLFLTFIAIVAIGLHTEQYERRLQSSNKEFKADVLALTGDQNIAIGELNRVVLDRTWINYQRLSLKQLKNFCDLRDNDPKEIIVVQPKRKNSLGGK